MTPTPSFPNLDSPFRINHHDNPHPEATLPQPTSAHLTELRTGLNAHQLTPLLSPPPRQV